MSNETKKEWDAYCTRERGAITPLLNELGYILDDVQPHLAGERYLMQAVTTTSGRKLILLGSRVHDGRRVVIKATRDQGGIRELTHERQCRRVLQTIRFAYHVFHTPEELAFVRRGRYLFSIQAFIEQERPFLDRSTEEQFALALSAFMAQESAHAATYEQARLVRKTFGSMNAEDYLASFRDFMRAIRAARPDDTHLYALLARANTYLAERAEVIEQYCGFLTHTDFVPHNFRVVGNTIYLLDNASLRFGNKYEGWARFLNFMALYNPSLDTALTDYVHLNRAPEEQRTLTCMRVYRLGEIIRYYAGRLSKSSGNQHALDTARIDFWSAVLDATLEGRYVDTLIRNEYRDARDRLRSSDENIRQKDLH